MAVGGDHVGRLPGTGERLSPAEAIDIVAGARKQDVASRRPWLITKKDIEETRQRQQRWAVADEGQRAELLPAVDAVKRASLDMGALRSWARDNGYEVSPLPSEDPQKDEAVEQDDWSELVLDEGTRDKIARARATRPDQLAHALSTNSIFDIAVSDDGSISVQPNQRVLNGVLDDLLREPSRRSR